MSAHHAWLLSAAILLLGTPTASGQPAPGPADPAAPGTPAAAQAEAEITGRSWPDKTALWVGDRVHFTIEIECAPTVDILSADLAGEKLGLTGLELVDVTSERIMGETGRLIYRFRYRLTTYETGEKPLAIADLTVRYGRRRAGQRLEEAAPAGELKIAGAALALRSTIPEELSSIDARDRRPFETVPRILTVARPVGIGLILLSAAPLLVWGGALVTRKRPRTRRRDTRAARSHTRAALDQLEPADTTSEAARREAYTRLDAVLREHLGNVTGLPTTALTPREIADRLASSKTTLPVDSVSEVLDECEKARYGPPALLPPPDRFRDAVSAAGRIVDASR